MYNYPQYYILAPTPTPKAKPKKEYKAVEKVIGFGDDVNRVWYYIPGYNGYEVSNDRYVRSMKHFNEYPYGILLTPKTRKNGPDIYELSDNSNQRVRLTIDEIVNLAKTCPYGVNGYPRRTCVTDTDSRNMMIVNRPQSSIKDTRTFSPNFVRDITPPKPTKVPFHFINDIDIN